jgi:antitoxin component of MazEF toxin-antitoxin module
VDKIIRKIQKRRTSFLLTIPENLLEKINCVGGDYLVLEFIPKDNSIKLKKIDLNKK